MIQRQVREQLAGTHPMSELCQTCAFVFDHKNFYKTSFLTKAKITAFRHTLFRSVYAISYIRLEILGIRFQIDFWFRTTKQRRSGVFHIVTD